MKPRSNGFQPRNTLGKSQHGHQGHSAQARHGSRSINPTNGTLPTTVVTGFNVPQHSEQTKQTETQGSPRRKRLTACSSPIREPFEVEKAGDEWFSRSAEPVRKKAKIHPGIGASGTQKYSALYGARDPLGDGTSNQPGSKAYSFGRASRDGGTASGNNMRERNVKSSLRTPTSKNEVAASIKRSGTLSKQIVTLDGSPTKSRNGSKTEILEEIIVASPESATKSVAASESPTRAFKRLRKRKSADHEFDASMSDAQDVIAVAAKARTPPHNQDPSNSKRTAGTQRKPKGGSVEVDTLTTPRRRSRSPIVTIVSMKTKTPPSSQTARFRDRMDPFASRNRKRSSRCSSEDELSGPTTMPKLSRPQKSPLRSTQAPSTDKPDTEIPTSGQGEVGTQHASQQRTSNQDPNSSSSEARPGWLSPGPSDEYGRWSCKLYLSSFLTRICRCSDEDDGSHYVNFAKNGHGFYVSCHGSHVLDPKTGKPAVFTSAHVQSIRCGETVCTVIVHGSRDDLSNGKMIFDFKDGRSCLGFIRRIGYMTLGSAKIREFSDAAIEKVCSKIWSEDSELTLSPTHTVVNDSELSMLQKRQTDRLASHARDAIEEEAPHCPKKTEVSDARPKKRKDNMTPLESKTEIESQPVRSSQRIHEKPARQSQTVTVQGLQPVPEHKKWTQKNSLPRWKAPFVYLESDKNRVQVDFDDIERLDEGEFLNDNLINFGLRQLQELHSESKEDVYIFNTYFYTALTSKGTKRAFNYEGVQRWTKKVDLFSYPFVVVPVNVDLHWFVMIICNLPNLSRTIVLDGDTQESVDQDATEHNISSEEVATTGLDKPGRRSTTPSHEFENLSLDTALKLARNASSPSGIDSPSVSENRDSEKEPTMGEAIASDVVSMKAKSGDPVSAKTPSTGRKGKKKGTQPIGRKQNPNDPLIITLDSFGTAHGAAIRHLKEYLVAEGHDKRSMKIERTDLSGVTAKGIPEQTNFWDCGLYLIGYVAEFLKSPRAFVEKACSKEFDQNNDFSGFDASKKRDEMRTDILRLQEEQRLRHKAEKLARIAARKAKAGGEAMQTEPVESPVRPSASTAQAVTSGEPGSSIVPAVQCNIELEPDLVSSDYGFLEGLAEAAETDNVGEAASAKAEVAHETTRATKSDAAAKAR